MIDPLRIYFTSLRCHKSKTHKAITNTKITVTVKGDCYIVPCNENATSSNLRRTQKKSLGVKRPHKGRKTVGPTSKISAACHAIPPAVTRSMPEIPSAPSVSNLPCPATITDRKMRSKNSSWRGNKVIYHINRKKN